MNKETHLHHFGGYGSEEPMMGKGNAATETPTPETDNHARCFQTAGMPEAYRILLDLARKLERERDEAREKLAAKAEFCDSLFLTETWDKLFAERDQLRKVADETWNSAIDAAIKEINRMIYAPSPRYDSLGRMTLACAAKKIDSLRKNQPNKKGQP